MDDCETAKRMGVAELGVKVINTADSTPTSVRRVSKHQPRQASTGSQLDKDKHQPCYHCGRRNHVKFLDATYHSCSTLFQPVALAQANLQGNHKHEGSDHKMEVVTTLIM